MCTWPARVEDLHSIQIMAIVEVFLGLRSAYFVLVQVHDVHLESVSGLSHGLEVNWSSAVRLANVLVVKAGNIESLLTLAMTVKAARVE